MSKALKTSGRVQSEQSQGRKHFFNFNDNLNTFLFTVIWRQTYGKGPLR